MGGTSTSTATCVRTSLPGVAAATVACTGTDFSAIEYPLWMVGWYQCRLQWGGKALHPAEQPGHVFQPFRYDRELLWSCQRGLHGPACYLEWWWAIFKVCTKTAGDETSCTLAE